jgi:predicted MFS family arabinose efflux permease
MKSKNWLLAVVGSSLWSVSLTIGGLRVILPVYFNSVGVSIPKIAFLFFLDTAGQILAAAVVGMAINRFGYRRCLLGGVGIHSALSFLYLFDPSFILIFFERFMRGVITMPLMTEVYVKHFCPEPRQQHDINRMLGIGDVSKATGMFIGGLLIALLPFKYSVLLFGVLTIVAALIALRYLPDLREDVKIPVVRAWVSVDPKIKTLGLSRGFLQGGEDAWASAILPLYLTTVFGLAPTLVGTIMMAGLLFYGINVSILSRWLAKARDRRKTLVMTGLLLFPICWSLSLPDSALALVLLICVYQFLNGVCAVYQNQLKLEFASRDKTSIDLAAFKTLSNIVKPLAVFVAGFLADTIGFSAVFYFASLLLLIAALIPLTLPKTQSRAAPGGAPAYNSEVAAINE